MLKVISVVLCPVRLPTPNIVLCCEVRPISDMANRFPLYEPAICFIADAYDRVWAAKQGMRRISRGTPRSFAQIASKPEHHSRITGG
jgi:hypothetical protein